MQLLAIDLLELDGADLRADPLERRKATLAKLPRRSHQGIELNDAALKAEFIGMERHWLLLASSFEFSESLGEFTAETRSGYGG